ncbi:cyclin-dependent kinase inhibitor 4-like [Curcuma longa]|uniref:cyclin-dependent kinase inhibitor 4-like n=1 Tax=Curcuma longa TaxID=136217 RepID=UPI003D9DCD22
MGKYMRKAKVAGEVAVMDLSHGVSTRARTLAAAAGPQDGSYAYLELRSRRLEKPLPPPPAGKAFAGPSPGPRLRASSGSAGSFSTRRFSMANEAPPDAQASFGENILEVEATDRNERETTPCSLIRNPEEMQTPGSTNRPTNSRATNRRIQTFRQNLPNAHEMEEFFSRAEQLQQQIFIERYNFDPANDHPLPGRFEWVKIDF